MTDEVVEVAPDRFKRDCLDLGFVRLVDHMGSDQRIVDSARVSYQQGTKAVQSDRHLIRYMLRHAHWTPFEKVVFEFHIKCPMYIGEQWLRHRMGSFNKISGRYSEMKDEFYVADPVRKQSTTNKQGSSEEFVDEIFFTDPIGGDVSLSASDFIEGAHRVAYQHYENLLAAGVAKEVARGVLPADLYTEFYWTVNLRSLFNFLELRLDGHAQKEIRDFSEAIMSLLREHVDIPFALEAFQDYVLDNPRISKFELEIIRQFIRDGVSEDNRSQLPGHARDLILNHPTMSKREKNESKLIKLLGFEVTQD